ncbi:3-hydroxyacyl-CoA dehydrogenase NAD-binding domain-containing protein [Dermacoccus abyssi]|uniref:3-hydroxyacyl-CoA dehydrogenase NAD-binding domain-containing protein n=1 Tax=Dermacoccus TaxID=57495 RepID=UPI0018792A11|nr:MULTISPECIES: 3-hydroxyacyl-CoA dehydrogenase NAD-binding domain-containing protein [Dermacoccus]MBE7371794.1 enoyl-CoA hydratase/isomerase family protein [Dermacoccus barathri]MCT1987372.1 3-hydroxyacyl-CoA dehydrogenase NAD-binding domain-containing protein [Dermacoccus abyssi]
MNDASKNQAHDEVVTHAHAQDIQLPRHDGTTSGTFVLITLDNGFDHTKPNSFGPLGLAELEAQLDTAAERAAKGEIVGLGVTGKPFIMAVGADLTGIPAITSREQAVEIAEQGHRVFSKIADLDIPTFAFVNGASMGGGVEIGLYCDYRTMSADVPAYSLPECFLGLVPGWGGTYLLPNLIGVENALQLIISNPLSNNKMATGAQAFKLGVADELLAPVTFLEDSLRFASDVISGEKKVERPEVDKDESTWKAACEKARAFTMQKTGGAAPAPLRAIDLVEAARTNTREQGFEGENEALGDLIMSDELRAGLYAFDLVQKRAKRPAGAPDKALARKVTKVGVVGAGLMASQLALLFIRRLDVPVIMTDLDQARVDKGVEYVHAEIDKLLEKKRVSPDKANRLKGLVTGSTSKDGFADADFVIEAVFEEMGVKKKVWSEVEAIVTPECVLATNTSSLSVTEMAEDLAHPERVVGFHFFNPVAVMPLLEIIRGDKTDDATLATAFATGKQLKKTCILVKNSPSFVVNRLLGRFMGEAGKIADEGTPVETVEKAFAGITPMPPFMLMSLVGPAIALHNSETLHGAFPDRFYVSPNLAKVVEAKIPGFYGKDGKLNEEVFAQFEKTGSTELTAEQVRDRALEALADETRRMLDEEVVAAPMDIDLAMITGAGFPFWNGGVTPLLDRLGISEKVTGQRFLPKGAASVAG